MEIRKSPVEISYLGLCAILDTKFGLNWKWEIIFRYGTNGDKHPVGKLWVKAQDLSEYEAVSHLDNDSLVPSAWKEINALYKCIDLILDEITRKEDKMTKKRKAKEAIKFQLYVDIKDK